MWNLWWTNWHWDRLSSESFNFSLSISFHRCSYSHIYAGLTEGTLEAQFHADTVSPQSNNTNKGVGPEVNTKITTEMTAYWDHRDDRGSKHL
jgi:hypothetical protein